VKDKTGSSGKAGNGDGHNDTGKRGAVVIEPPRFGDGTITIVGIAPLVINAFSAKAREQMRLKQEQGSQGNKGKKRDPKDFQASYEAAKHISREGWCGIPAAAFRNAMISACRIVGFKMTLAKLSVFVESDGYDAVDNAPLVKITKGEPKYTEVPVRNESGVIDLRPRPMWAEGWEAAVRVRWDEDQFSSTDIANLMARAGLQVGVGEGRPDSKNSPGQGWGLFRIKTRADA
jgi:hypothetical protein